MTIKEIINETLKKIFTRADKDQQEVPEDDAPTYYIPEPVRDPLWYPKAITPSRKMRTSFKYEGGYPVGAVVHCTAGRDKDFDDAMASYNWGCDNGFVYFVIAPQGEVIQGFPLNEGGAHAGRSSWPGLGENVSRKLVGIEIVNAGKLENNRSWFGVLYKSEDIRDGFKKCTPEQERSLKDLIAWLKKDERFKLVLGHDDVSPGRKTDPGKSLSFNVKEL
jgi:N-acetylmuramoyl-L-alanine amidase